MASLELPILAAKSVLEEPWGPAAAEALREEGIELSQLTIPGVRRPYFGESLRALFVVAQNVELGEPELDEMSGGSRLGKRVVAFELPRGSYATVVLRSLGQ
jgi:tRNA(Glu) U13 pseudouridine synthase TruD